MAATIIVIDDDMQVVQLLKNGLEDEGYRVVAGYDGQMALQMAHTQRPSLIILDVNMPMTNGVKAFELLRKNNDTKAIPVLFLTGANSSFVYPAIENQQRVAFLKKPVDLEHVSEMARDLITKYPV